jgi:RNA polymerase sigma factor (sigma-70 family)
MRDRDFERMYAEHAEGLLAFLVYRIGDRAAAEDVLADTFERVLTTRRGFDARRGKEKTWLYSIALNLVRDRVRRATVEDRVTRERARDPVATGGAGWSERSPFDAIDDRDALRRALSTLNAEEREAIALRYGADLTVPEIARLMNEKLTTIEGRVYRGLRKLRQEFE